MEDQAKNGQIAEQRLIKLYMELTGCTEAAARGVFMYLPVSAAKDKPAPGDSASQDPSFAASPDSKPIDPMPARPSGASGLTTAVLMLAALCCCSPVGRAAPVTITTNNILDHPLSLADAVNLALRRNPNILRAQKDVEVAQGVTIETRAIAVPKVSVTGGYNASQPSDVDILAFNVPGMPHVSFGNSQNWVSQVKLVQSLYEGGRILSALRSARLTKEQSTLNYQTTVADAVRDVEIAYDDVLLGLDQIAVQEASVELLTRELNDTRQRFDAGTVPRFNVLRAQVELANEQPKLIHARNDYRIAKNNLANLMGFSVPKETIEDIPLILAGKLEAVPYSIELSRAIILALERRTELGALRKAQALRQEDVVNAKAGYKPSIQAFGGYDAHNTSLATDLGIIDHGWITGVQLSWNIFDGRRTQGRVIETQAQLERAGVDLDDTGRRIELEVRTAHSNFIEADETLQSQQKNVEEAEEALRLARARNEAGTGTQLDVLSAQTALTDARVTQIQALHDYCVARARLDRAMGSNLPGNEPAH
jgi:outer membrane protein TolC